MEPLARLDSKSILSEEIFLEIFDQEDEITKARMILSLTDRAGELGVKKKFEELLKAYKRVDKEAKQRERKPDIKMDFREMPFSDNTFKIVVFDPPHLKQAGSESWLAKKYGVLPKDWKPYLKAGFDECMKVLEPDGILVFKWNEEQIKLNDVLKEFGKKPLLGDQRGKTRWILFMK